MSNVFSVAKGSVMRASFRRRRRVRRDTLEEAAPLRSRTRIFAAVAIAVPVLAGITGFGIWSQLRPTPEDDSTIARYCLGMVASGLRSLADNRGERFLGKVPEAAAACRGGEKAVAHRATPWVDWSNYWGTGDVSSRSDRRESGSHVLDRNKRGVDGALLDLEYQRMELIKFNLFDNSTFEQYLTSPSGTTAKVWPEMRLPADHANFGALEIGADGGQLCKGELIRFRTVTGICNDIRNPAMGSTGQLLARNVEFESTSPELELNTYSANRHGGRISLLEPDPQ